MSDGGGCATLRLVKLYAVHNDATVDMDFIADALPLLAPLHRPPQAGYPPTPPP
jgi:hypothetical protein